MSLRIKGESKREFIIKLSLYSAIYGLLSINYIDLVIPGSNVPGYHLWLLFQYFLPFIPLLFLLGFDDWELVLSMGLLGSLFNDLGYAPIGMLIFNRKFDLINWYSFQLGFQGYKVWWYFDAVIFRIPVTSIGMGISIYTRITLTFLLCLKWWRED
jgi:hypothetical protein